MSVVGYPQPGKAKSLEILGAFCAGAGGRVVYARHARKLDCAAAAFYGTMEIEDLFWQAYRRSERGAGDFYYLDNAYFDRARNRYFRATRNGLQRALARPDFGRLKQLGVEIQPWRRSGSHVLIVEQSDYFMRELALCKDGIEDWRSRVVRAIEHDTDRPIVVRRWIRDKAKASSSLAEDLADAWAVVTHSSAAAVEALIAGIPVLALAGVALCEGGIVGFENIETPSYPEGREEWAARLAASQWTLEEMRAGLAWRALQDQREEQTA